MVLAGSLFGYVAGMNAASSTRTSFVREDSDIMRAFDERLIKQSFAVSGINNSYVSLAHNDEFRSHKPYWPNAELFGKVI